MRVLIVSNMYPSRERPEYGVFVREQLEALSRIEGVEVDLHVTESGGMKAYRRSVKPLKKLLKSRDYDVVHAHFGLTGWVAKKAGAKPLMVTFHGNDLTVAKSQKVSRSVAKKVDQVAVVSEELGEYLGRAANKLKRPAVILPTGVNLERFKPIDRRAAREALSLDPEGSYVLFPHNPDREVKRYDRVLETARRVEDVEVLRLGGVPPEHVPLYVNAADAVLVPSEFEGFGLAVIEASACNVPAIATPTGIAPTILSEIGGSYCLAWEPDAWARALEAILADPDPRVRGREVAQKWSTDAMAARVVEAYRALLSEDA